MFSLLKFINKDLDLKQKKILYRQVCIPTIAYAAKSWLPDLKFEYQFKALRRIQRRAMIATTGCYCRTPLMNMLNLTGTLEIVNDLDITVKLNKEERKEAHSRLLQEQGYDELFEVLDECRSKEVLWFYTGQGALP